MFITAISIPIVKLARGILIAVLNLTLYSHIGPILTYLGDKQ